MRAGIFNPDEIAEIKQGAVDELAEGGTAAGAELIVRESHHGRATRWTAECLDHWVAAGRTRKAVRDLASDHVAAMHEGKVESYFEYRRFQ